MGSVRWTAPDRRDWGAALWGISAEQTQEEQLFDSRRKMLSSSGGSRPKAAEVAADGMIILSVELCSSGHEQQPLWHPWDFHPG